MGRLLKAVQENEKPLGTKKNTRKKTQETEHPKNRGKKGGVDKLPGLGDVPTPSAIPRETKHPVKEE